MYTNIKFKKIILTKILAITILVISNISNTHALIVGMPDLDWVVQYTTGMCSDKFGSNRYLTWQQLKAADNGSIDIGDDEKICIVGHGSPGSIGNIEAADIAKIITDKINHFFGFNNDMLLVGCYSAVTPIRGISVMRAMQNIGGVWRGNPLVGSLGICVADRNGDKPLYLTVLKYPLPDSGVCSRANLNAKQSALQANVQIHIDNCQQNNVDDLAIGQCLYDLSNPDGQAINNNFYMPFLNYITTNNCYQYPGVVEGEM